MVPQGLVPRDCRTRVASFVPQTCFLTEEAGYRLRCKMLRSGPVDGLGTVQLVIGNMSFGPFSVYGLRLLVHAFEDHGKKIRRKKCCGLSSPRQQITRL